MSQKTAKRVRRPTNDDDNPLFKSPSKINKEEVASVDEISPPSEEAATKPETNGKSQENPESDRVTRSRSNTPLLKKPEEKTLNGNNHHPEPIPEETKEETNEEENLKNGDEEIIPGRESPEMMDPLVPADDPDPELVFDDNSDLESGKESPILNRCETRRSQLRNIPTPKTPKVDEQEKQEEDNADLNVTFESCSENVSTKAEAGSDSTRLAYMEASPVSESNSFLAASKGRSFEEILRKLPSRRSIRPLTDEYKRSALRNNHHKSELNQSSIESVSVGIKRKRSIDEEDNHKRFKEDSPSGFFSRFTSPLTNIKNPFRSDLPSSTPKLMGYKDDKYLVESDANRGKECGVSEEKRWCSIM